MENVWVLPEKQNLNCGNKPKQFVAAADFYRYVAGRLITKEK